MNKQVILPQADSTDEAALDPDKDKASEPSTQENPEQNANKPALKTNKKQSLPPIKGSRSSKRKIVRFDKSKNGDTSQELGGRKKPALGKLQQSKAGPDRTKKLKETQAAWKKEMKLPKIPTPRKKSSVKSLGASSKGGRVEPNPKKGKDKGAGKGYGESMGTAGKGVQDLAETTPGPGRVIEVQPAKPHRVEPMQHRMVQTSHLFIGNNVLNLLLESSVVLESSWLSLQLVHAIMKLQNFWQSFYFFLFFITDCS